MSNDANSDEITVEIVDGIRNVTGTAEADDIQDWSGEDIVIRGGGGADTIRTGEGNDVLHGQAGDDVIEGGQGEDWLTGGVGDDTLDGGHDGDTLEGNAGDDVLKGGGGSDWIMGGTDDDTIYGGDDGDVLEGGEGDDAVYGGIGGDVLRGGEGEDVIEGGAGDDELIGGTGADIFVFAPGHGDDYIGDFDPGGDMVDLAAFEGLVFEDLIFVEKNDHVVVDIPLPEGGSIKFGGLTAADLSARHFLFAELPEAAGGREAGDRVVGSHGADAIDEAGGDDTILSIGGDDFIWCGEGDDTVHAGRGEDVVFGGSGDDSLYGYLGDDILRGEEGDDVLDGERGHDALFGGVGDDTLDGGFGDDVLVGGAGADTFMVLAQSANPQYPWINGIDTIKDFSDGEDVIDLTQFADTSRFGDLDIFSDGTTAVIDLTVQNGGTVRLENTSLGDLDAEDFLFHAALSNTQEQVPPSPPAFGVLSYLFALAENTDGSTDRVSLGTVSATDPEGAALSYSIEGGNEAGLFEIDAGSGELFYVGAGEDFEAGTGPFELTVRANDGDLSVDATVTVSVTDVEEAPADADSVRAGATDLGDITDLEGPRFRREGLDGSDDAIDYYRFTLTEAREVGLGLRRQDADADLFIEDANGNMLYSSTEAETASEAIWQTLEAGTYYVRVEAREAGANAHVLRYGVVEPARTDDYASDATTTGRVEIDGSNTGEIETAADFDWFAVELVAERTYVIDLEGDDTGGGTLDSTVLRGLYDADGARIAGTQTNGGGEGDNARLTYTAGESGTYYIAARGYMDQTGSYTVRVTDSTPAETQEPVQEPPVSDALVDPPVQESVPEPSGQDFAANTSTAGRVAAGDSVTGDIGSGGDRDWFAVELEAGRTYRFDLMGSPTGDGTLPDPYLRGIYDEDGDFIASTTDDDGGVGRNSRETYTAGEDGTYYVAAGAYRDNQGTYTLWVEEVVDGI